MSDRRLTRRALIGRALADRRVLFASMQSSAPAAGQTRLAPRVELVNTLEYAEQAQRVLAPDVYASIADGDRSPFDRITLRPRMLVRTTDLDISLTLFGAPHFAPILVAPIERQTRFHPAGERETARGASAASATMIASSRSDAPLEAIVEAAASDTPPWFQVFAGDHAASEQMTRAVAAGCRAICVTVGAAPTAPGARTVARRMRIDWSAVGRLVRSVRVPVLVKGVSSPEAAATAISSGAHGLVVSNYGGVLDGGEAPLILTLPQILDRVAGQVPVLVDGGFRRGTDILKALAFGATAVLVGRPVMWGLAAYGADGVQGVIGQLQTELARYMAMSGKPALGTLDRTLLRVHER